MRRFMIPALALTLMAAPAVLEAQAKPRAGGGMHAMRAGGVGNPAERVLRHREALGLTQDQVRQLEQLQARHAAQNQPLLDQLREVRPAMGQRGAMTDEQRAEMRERMQQRGAMTNEQRADMRERMQGQRGAMTDEERAGMRGRMQQRGGAREARPEVRAEMEALRPVMEALRASHAQGREQVQAVLTAEQAQRMQELQRGGGAARPRGEGVRRGAGFRR
jgi:Spy/CpxP family protein refolding chaperone